MPIRFLDMFAGIGGFRSGLERLGGYECVGYCEIDKYAKQAYDAMYPTEGELYFADARTIDPYTLPDIDLTPKTQTAKLRLSPMKPRLFERYMSDTYPAKACTESNAISKQKRYRHLPDAVYGGRKPFVPSSRTRNTKATPS